MPLNYDEVQDVWTGLRLQNVTYPVSNGVYKWDDGTYFDFGNNISGGVYPWRKNRPDNTDVHNFVILCKNFRQVIIGMILTVMVIEE